MKRSQIDPMPQYYNYYINLVADVELSDAFDQSIRQLDELNRDRLTKLDGQTYAPNKWTVKEILQHVMGFMMIGHQIHHLKVIEEKYFPLLQPAPAELANTSH